MRVIELFCGVGGLGLGLKQAGMTIHSSYDAWQAAMRVLCQNGGYGWAMDLADVAGAVSTLTGQNPQLIAGGPPCQDFSAAGRREATTRSNLTENFAMIIAIIKPEWFIYENVRDAAKSKSYGQARNILSAAGYGLTEEFMDASFYGTPQARHRFIVVGRLGEIDGFLSSALKSAAAARPMSLRDAFGDELGDAINVHPRGGEARRRIWGTDFPAPTVRSSYRRPLPADYAGHPGDSPYAIPPVSPTRAQVARIQGFSPDFDWSGVLLGDVDKMVGNAVPPPLAKAIGQCIMDRHAGRTIPDLDPGFAEFVAAQGWTNQSVVNVLNRVKRARTLLGGRTYSSLVLEIAALEAVAEFQALKTGPKSDLRAALRLYADLPRTPSPYIPKVYPPRFGRRKTPAYAA